MCNDLKEAVLSANRNTDTIANKIDNLNIPCNYKGVFMHLADERGFRFDNDTLSKMEVIGNSESEVCLSLLQGNHKTAGLISAYQLATKLPTDKERAEVLEIINEDGKKTITEKNVLLAILTLIGKV